MKNEKKIRIKNIKNFDKKKLLKIVSETIKMSKTDTLRGRCNNRRLNRIIMEGRTDITSECSSEFYICNNNGWLSGAGMVGCVSFDYVF